MTQSIAIIGIGYVGLSSALSFAKAGLKVIAFDKNEQRIAELLNGHDCNKENTFIELPNLIFTAQLQAIKEATTYIISVPTPLNAYKVPDISALKIASEMIASFLKKNDLVILESTVFPGATRELVIPILEKGSALKAGEDFFVGYSSERIVPGDSRSTNLNTATKVISGQNEKALQHIKRLYEHIPELALYCAANLEVAESSKLLENIQRNVNIALMNEFAQLMDNMNIPFREVWEAARTKWNFLPFTPGLVGGHCIPEDPHYLIYKADKTDAVHNLINCACQINQQFYHFITQVLLKLLLKQDIVIQDARIVILGMSFKSNVSDTRHSLSFNLYEELKKLGLHVQACDPLVDSKKFEINWVELEDLPPCHALIVCQAHHAFLKYGAERLTDKLLTNGIFLDIPGAFFSHTFRKDILYWGL